MFNILLDTFLWTRAMLLSFHLDGNTPKTRTYLKIVSSGLFTTYFESLQIWIILLVTFLWTRATFPFFHLEGNTPKRRTYLKIICIGLYTTYFESLQTWVITYLMHWAIWYHLYNLKNVKNTHEGVLILAKLQASSSMGVFHVF